MHNIIWFGWHITSHDLDNASHHMTMMTKLARWLTTSGSQLSDPINPLLFLNHHHLLLCWTFCPSPLLYWLASQIFTAVWSSYILYSFRFIFSSSTTLLVAQRIFLALFCSCSEHHLYLNFKYLLIASSVFYYSPTSSHCSQSFYISSDQGWSLLILLYLSHNL